MTMFSSLTPAATRELRAPLTRAEMTLAFQRAWTMAIRRFEPDADEHKLA